MPPAPRGAGRLEALQQAAASPLSIFQAKLMLCPLINEGKHFCKTQSSRSTLCFLRKLRASAGKLLQRKIPHQLEIRLRSAVDLGCNMLDFGVVRFNFESPERETGAALIRQPDAKSQVERGNMRQQRLVQGLSGESSHRRASAGPAGASGRARKLFPNYLILNHISLLCFRAPAKREAAFGFAAGDTRRWEPWVGVPLPASSSRSLSPAVPQFPQLRPEGYIHLWEEKGKVPGREGCWSAGQEVLAERSPSPPQCGMPLATVSRWPSWPGPTGRRFH